jgi:hypothetical protein
VRFKLLHNKEMREGRELDRGGSRDRDRAGSERVERKQGAGVGWTGTRTKAGSKQNESQAESRTLGRQGWGWQ